MVRKRLLLWLSLASLLGVLVLFGPAACSSDLAGASARVITYRSELIGGDRAAGEIGDFIIENEKVRFVIQKSGASRGFGVFGGSILDADLRRPTPHTPTPGVGGTTLVRYISTTVLVIVGMVAVLALFGISVVPMFTALGVGGLAVALAFQDTLANVFSGLNLTLARQIRVGDYVEVGELEGFIIDIGWRATTLRTLEGPHAFIPNKKLAESVMVNLSRSDPGMSVAIEFRVALEIDPDRVEAVVLDEVVRAAAALPGIRAEEPPIVRFRAFGDSALEVRACVAGRRYQDRFLIKHEVMKRLHRRLRAEGITVPVPQRVVRAVAAEVAAPPPADPSTVKPAP